MFPAGLPVIRPESVEMSVWGVASLAGLEAGVWRGVEQLDTMRSVRRTVMDSAVQCSIGSTTGFHNHGEGPY